MTELYAGRPSPEMYDYLIRRRSAKNLIAPGPDAAKVRQILQAASRVPDHGKMFPWYFITFQGDNRAAIGDLLKKAWLIEEQDASPAKLALEAERFLRAPVVIGVISKVREGKHPAWEQILSAGAACMNLCLAANALGFGTAWLTEWYTYNKIFKEGLGLSPGENIAGFVHIGTPAQPPEERDRPDLDRIVTEWVPGMALNKGEGYGLPGKGLPKAGFDLL